MNKIEISLELKNKHLTFLKKKKNGYTEEKKMDKNSYYKNCLYYKILDDANYDSSLSSSTYTLVRKFLCDNFDIIAVGKPKELINLSDSLKDKVLQNEGMQNSAVTSSNLNKLLKKIYNYEIFQNTKCNDWNPHLYTKILTIIICPYCNCQYAYTIDEQPVKIRPTLDHFFSQSDYPLLSLSIYNLIPSCSICNSTLKGRTKFDLDNYFHPNLDNISDHFLFVRDIGYSGENNIDYYSQILGLSNGYKLKMNSENFDSKHKMKNQNDIFHITRRSEELLDFLNENIMTYIKSKSIYVESLEKEYNLNITNSDVYSKFKIDNYNEKILSKLVDDIINKELSYAK